MISILKMNQQKWTQKDVAREALSRLDKQGKPSFIMESPNSNCLYYSKELKAKCAVGLLLPDEYAKFATEAKLDGISELIDAAWKKKLYTLCAALNAYQGLLLDLQRFHDSTTQADWAIYCARDLEGATHLKSFYGSKALEKLYDKLRKSSIQLRHSRGLMW